MNVEDMDTTTLEICVDCLFYLANGEVTDGEGNDITAAHGAAIASVWGDAERDPWFSWSSCDGCGSTLGGDREYATAWTPKSGHEGARCTDCGCA